jgi:hypothetical protein
VLQEPPEQLSQLLLVVIDRPSLDALKSEIFRLIFSPEHCAQFNAASASLKLRITSKSV